MSDAISRELLGKIVDEVFDGAIEDASVIEDIYAAIKRHEAPSPHTNVVGSDPVAEIVEATSPAAELIFGRDIKFFEALRTLPIGTKLYAAPLSVGGDRHQRILGILDDFAEMQPEEDEDWESWYHASFDLARQKIRAALPSPMDGGE